MIIVLKKYLILSLLGVVLLSTGFQLLWLRQVFIREFSFVQEESEQAVREASRRVMYDNLLHGKDEDRNYRDFFFSPGWINLKTAFDAITDNNANRFQNSLFSSSTSKDSVVVNIHFRIVSESSLKLKLDGVQHPALGKPTYISEDRRSIDNMDRTVKLLLKKADLNVRSYYSAIRYKNNDEVISFSAANPVKKPAFLSRKYSYDLKYKNKYQLIIPELYTAVLWRMRYNIISALIIIILIGFAFYNVMKSYVNKKLYAEAKIAFTSNMSHELKTPLAIMEVALDSITRYNLLAKPDKLADYIDISKTELQRLKRIIDKALGVEDLDNGNIKLDKELYDVQQCLELVVASMSVQLLNKDATITFKPSPEPCFVSGDPVHLTNVFYNLIENALKYGHPGVHIIVNCTFNSEVVKISVRDDGPGIASIYHEKIFERFFRVTSEQDIHEVKGSGLGLNYVKQIIEMHGGSISVQSDAGSGSDFVIKLPLSDQ